MAQDVDVIGIDEAQFFDDEIANVCDELALHGIRVIVAGLDMDYSASHLARCLFCWQKPTTSPSSMQFVCDAAILRITLIGKSPTMTR